MDDPDRTARRIARFLRALGQDPAGLEAWERLGGGSGSAVYRLGLNGDDVVLKTIASGQDANGREVRFYRDLASRVPLRVPGLLASARCDDLDCLLLRAATPAPPPADWPVRRWLRVAAELGALHRSGVLASCADQAWLSSSEPDVDGPAVVADFWQHSTCAAIASDLVQRRAQLAAWLTDLPSAVVHGDCHAENLLLQGAHLIWADWAQVHRGRGPEDLALLWQRAEFDGAQPPREQMLARYARARGIAPDHRLRQAVTAAEVTLLLHGWPAHLVHADEQGRARMIGLLRRLAAGIDGGASG